MFDHWVFFLLSVSLLSATWFLNGLLWWCSTLVNIVLLKVLFAGTILEVGGRGEGVMALIHKNNMG